MKTTLLSILTFIFITSQVVSLKAVELIGAGATFPYPLYSKMFDTYYQLNKVKVNYQSIGSGGGIKQLLSKTVNFGASDAVMEDAEKAKAPVAIHHIPTCLGADVITYNLPGNPKLKLTPEVIAGIFLGKITNWNDSKIKKLNPKAKLPKQGIVVIHRSDGSGTTYIFSDYLCKVSSEWEKKVGRGKSLNWPVGLGGKGNEGVSGLIKQTPGSIGYTELIYATGNKMPVASIKNSSGNFIYPSIKSVSESANINLPDDTEVSITNTSAYNGYPISSFTWLLVYDELNVVNLKEEEAKAMMKLLWWMIHDGQKLVEPLQYAPLSPAAVKKAENLLKSVKFKGKNIL
ncbi:MAG: phosphate ABC transporter substrate-binding protein PstS [bacterium]